MSSDSHGDDVDNVRRQIAEIGALYFGSDVSAAVNVQGAAKHTISLFSVLGDLDSVVQELGSRCDSKTIKNWKIV